MTRIKVERSTCKYYSDRVRAFKMIKDLDERQSFIMNTFIAFQKDEWKVALSPDVCHNLEELISFSNSDCLALLLKVLSKSWDGVINSKFAYHVLHKALLKCQSTEFSDDSSAFDFVKGFCDHMWQNLDRYLTHPHACHTARLYLKIAAGVSLKKNEKTNIYDYGSAFICRPFDENYAEVLTKLCDRFLLTNNLSKHVEDVHMCPFLQILLIIISLRLSDFFNDNFKKFMKYSSVFARNDGETGFKKRLRAGFVHPVAVYFTETLISTMPGAIFSQFLQKRILKVPNSLDGNEFCISNASIFAAHPMASRILRATIKRLTKTADVYALLSTLKSVPQVEDFSFGLTGAIKNGQHHVLNDLAELCIKYPSDEIQRLFLNMIPIAFGVQAKKAIPHLGEDLLIRCLISMTHISELSKSVFNNTNNENTCGVNEENLTDNVTLPGCLFVQTLLKFEFAYPTRIVTSLLTQSHQRLIAWASHSMLSRVLEAFLQSKCVTSDRKLTLLNLLKIELSNLACNPYGSHVVEAFWQATDSMPQSLDQKELIAKELCTSANKLKSHKYGHFIYFKLGLETYQSDRISWINRFKIKAESGNRKTVGVGNRFKVSLINQQNKISNKRLFGKRKSNVVSESDSAMFDMPKHPNDSSHKKRPRHLNEESKTES